MISREHNRGSALAELAGLLPIYVLVILGLLYIGDLAGIRMNLQPTAEQAAAQPDTTSHASLQQEFAEYNHSGSLTLDRAAPEASPRPGRVAEIIERICVHPEARAFANVSWKFVNGELIPVVDTGSRTKPRELDATYLEDNKPELIEMTLHGMGAGYMVGESSAEAMYHYKPGYVVPYEALDTQEIRAKHTALIRGTGARETEGTAQDHPVEKLVGAMPPRLEPQKLTDLPKFMTYDPVLWWPDKKRSTP